MSSRVLILDPLKCTGCRICELACSYISRKSFNPAISRIRVITWFEKGISIPIYCQQCDPAPCLEVCPTGALYRDSETGVILWNKDKCIGCKACIAICPFGAIFYDPKEKLITKCDMCNGKPLCVELCPTGALSYEEALRIIDVKRREAASKFYELITKLTIVGK
ncbi:MAG: 4Fe-4S dicluster domain-containing protein [Thermoprotei archaeon]|nr:MAG: 4Fe-4S dicluster domain-containing protein [Thermoprotei archaeon]